MSPSERESYDTWRERSTVRNDSDIEESEDMEDEPLSEKAIHESILLAIWGQIICDIILHPGPIQKMRQMWENDKKG